MSARVWRNRYSRSPEELAEVRARIADAHRRAARGEIRDDSQYAEDQLAKERAARTAREVAEAASLADALKEAVASDLAAVDLIPSPPNPHEANE